MLPPMGFSRDDGPVGGRRQPPAPTARGGQNESARPTEATTRHRRPSRTTVPIAPEALEPLVAATASHAIVAKASAPSREQPAFESAWASHAADARSAPADAGVNRSGGAPASAPDIADLTEDAVEEFAARGGSLHEVLASVTADHRAAVPQDWVASATPVSRSQARPAAAPAPRRQLAPREEEEEESDEAASARDTNPRIHYGSAAEARAPAVTPAPRPAPAGSGRSEAPLAPPPARSAGGRSLGGEVTELLGRAAQLHHQGEFDEAFATCQRVLQLAPGHALAAALAQRIEAALMQAAEERLGSLEAIPIVRVPSHEITWHKLDHQAGFVLSRIDGLMSYNDVLTVSGMPRAAALRTLVRLLELKLIAAQH